MKICALVPAAGRGTRLGTDTPKILTPLTAKETIWSILHARLAPLVDHIHLVLSPRGAAMFPPLPANVSTSIQPTAIGMGDAIFRGYHVWSRFDAVLVVWGDQVFVSTDTLRRAVAALAVPDSHAVLPVTRMAVPYVEYVFDGPRLSDVRLTREGDITTPNGFSDVGTFLLGTRGLKPAWEDFLAGGGKNGSKTGEINFLPFLPFLSARGWAVTPLEVADATEARGINTQDDLAFFQNLYKSAP
jgi:bifunctional UDP-N-acetylglucosamine pyrophosphorylase/glucosamine-1-phosphate N-acetyltransferase